MRLRGRGLTRPSPERGPDPDRRAGPEGPPGPEPDGTLPPRTLVGGVGYSNLRDFSVGPLLVGRLEARARAEGWPPQVSVEDLSYDPVKIRHLLVGSEPPVERLVVATAARRGRAPGSVTAYRWDASLPEPEQIQVRVAEAVTGVIHLDNLLVVLGAFDAAPPEVYVVEVEPEVEAMGDELTPAVARGAARAEEMVRRIAIGGAGGALPSAPLGGFGSGNGDGPDDEPAPS